MSQLTIAEAERRYDEANKRWLDCRGRLARLKEQLAELESVKNESYRRYYRALLETKES